jgi:L-seryl-tRNA(Ser) seleniumtransferase
VEDTVTTSKGLLRELPSIDRLFHHTKIEPLLARFNRAYVTEACRDVLAELRQAIRDGAPIDSRDFADEAILAKVEHRVYSSGSSALTPVVNATGTVLHTNLGRALLPDAAIDALCLAAGHHVNLEYDLARGERGKREALIEQLLTNLTGAEAATVVNNNAAALLLALNTLAEGKEVIVSRGELIEIGGAFRIPDIMAKSGAILREVGTTNRTHPEDYEQAIGERTGLLLKVHTSNYRIVGFSASVDLPALVPIARRHGIPVLEDLGSGALIDLSRYGLPKEPVVADRIAMGADLVTFSGDKVLGGPQAGILVGTKAAMHPIARNPLHRAVRCGKLTIAALDATLRLYQQSADIVRDIPTLRAFSRSIQDIEDMGTQLVPALRAALGQGFEVSMEDATSQIGSGALPTEEIPTKVIAVRGQGRSADWIAARFRSARPPIIGRIKDDCFLLDLRTIGDPETLIPRWSNESPVSV